MLRCPYGSQPFKPTLRLLVSCFFQETHETLLSAYNPNDPVELERLLRQHCLMPEPRETFRHRQARFEFLEQALADPDTDFDDVWDIDEEKDGFDIYEYPSWPKGWGSINDSRGLFELYLATARDVWRDDLVRANLPSLVTCREIPARDRGGSDWLFSVDNPQGWKEVFGHASTPEDLYTQGPVFDEGGLKLHLEGPLNLLRSLPSSWPTTDPLTDCEFDVSVEGISEMEMRGTGFGGRVKTRLTPLKPGYHLRLEIGFDCVIECVAQHVSLCAVQGSRSTK